MATDTNNATRRQALVALAGAPVAIMAAPAAAHQIDSTEWDQTFAAMIRAGEAKDRAAEEWNRLYAQFEAARDAVPHATFRPDPHTGRTEPVSTADQLFVRAARRLVADVRAGRCYLETDRYTSLRDHWQLCQEVAAAADAREAEIAAISQRLGFTAIDERYEALVSAFADLESALMAMPSPHTEALLWKLELLLEGDGPQGETAGFGGAFVAQTKADMRRLLSAEA